MKLKTSLSLLALASCAAVSTSALAQSTGTLNIAGNISPVSCTPQLTGGAISGNTLTLPDAYIADLANANDTTQATPFTFLLTGCSTGTGIDNMWVNFTGVNVDGNGRITPTAGSANVRFELRNGVGGDFIKAGDAAAAAGPSVTQGTGAAFTGTNPGRSASKTYAVQYFTPTGLTLADVGAVTSSVTYNVYYY